MAAVSHSASPVIWCSVEQPGRQRRVVLEDCGAVADAPAEAGAAQPAVDGVQVEHRSRASRCGVEEFGLVERDARLGERGDRPAVPCRDDLVVATRLRPSRPGGQQRGPDPIEPLDVVGVRRQLQHRAAVLERARVGDAENRCRPTPVVVTEHFAQLGGRPRVGQALDAVGIGVQRGDEHAVGAELVDHEPRCLAGDPARQGITGTARPVRVGPQQQCVVVEHLLEVRYHPRVVDAVAGEATGELVVDAAAGHRDGGALDGRQRRRLTGAFMAAQQCLKQRRRRELGRCRRTRPWPCPRRPARRRRRGRTGSACTAGPPPGSADAIDRSSVMIWSDARSTSSRRLCHVSLTAASSCRKFGFG